MSYDESNIFARIVRGEIPAAKIYEDDHVLAINDINPRVMPKGRYVSFDDFSERASGEEIAAFVRAVGRIAKDAGVAETGYRLVFNHGADSHQEVPHLHAHILGGKRLGPLLDSDF
jgi:diadenosine tetraphosphate (Ap4A) HIT family hydrolase